MSFWDGVTSLLTEAFPKVAESISKYTTDGRSLTDLFAPSMTDITESANKNVALKFAKNIGFEDSFVPKTFDDLITKMNEMGGQPQFTDNIRTRARNKLGENASKEASDILEAKLSAFQNIMAGADDIAKAKTYNVLAGKKNPGDHLGISGIMSGYFGEQGGAGAIRTGAALGIYGAGSLGLRTLSGGDLTHNSRGENDIAGIPFF